MLIFATGAVFYVIGYIGINLLAEKDTAILGLEKAAFDVWLSDAT
jgi:hypothetical protein